MVLWCSTVIGFQLHLRVVRFNTKSCQASSLAARQSDAYSRRTYGFVLMVNSVRASACSANPTAVLVLQASPSVGHVAQRAASTSGLSDVEMAEQLDDIMADARCCDGETDEPAAPMAEESAVDSTSAAVDTAPLVEGEEPSNWANLPDGILQEVRATLKGVARSSLHVRRVPAHPSLALRTLGTPADVICLS